MRRILPKKLIELAKYTPTPLYVVGGSVRDFLANLTPKAQDFDITAPLPAETFAKIAEAHGFIIQSVYKNTGTVKLSDEENKDYEYTCFRSDKYVRGVHVPVEIYFTDDIHLDARRRRRVRRTLRRVRQRVRERRMAARRGQLNFKRKELNHVQSL